MARKVIIVLKPFASPTEMVKALNNDDRKLLFNSPKDVALELSISKNATWDSMFSLSYNIYKGVEIRVKTKQEGTIVLNKSEDLVNLCSKLVELGVLPETVTLDYSDKAYVSKKIFLDMFPSHLEPTGDYLYLLDDEVTWVAYEPIDSARGGINGYIATKPQMHIVKDVVSYKTIHPKFESKTYTFKDDGKLEFAKKYFDGYDWLCWENVPYNKYLEVKEIYSFINDLPKYPDLLLDMIKCCSIESWQECLVNMYCVFGNKYLDEKLRGMLNTKFALGEDTYFRNEEMRTLNLDRFDYDGEEEFEEEIF